jgi:hypothetical protein
LRAKLLPEKHGTIFKAPFRKITCKNLTGLANLSGLAREIIYSDKL